MIQETVADHGDTMICVNLLLESMTLLRNLQSNQFSAVDFQGQACHSALAIWKFAAQAARLLCKTGCSTACNTFRLRLFRSATSNMCMPRAVAIPRSAGCSGSIEQGPGGCCSCCRQSAMSNSCCGMKLLILWAPLPSNCAPPTGRLSKRPCQAACELKHLEKAGEALQGVRSCR